MWRRFASADQRKILDSARPFERVVLAAAVFSLFAMLGFIGDVMSGGRQPALVLAANVLFAGGIAVAYGWAATVNPLLMVIPFAVHMLYAFWLVDLVPAGAPLTELADQQRRLRGDALGILAAMVLSYVCFLVFITRTSVRHVAAQTEIALARDIHRVLVPPIARTIGAFEFAGASIPSGDVGGDLVDVVEPADGVWMAYVADVSGHGVSSGLLMGMVKSAVRMRTRSEWSAAPLLAELDAVLEPLKSPAMFVTMAVVTFEAGRLEFALAGHLPILRIRADGRVEEISLAQLPVGLMPGSTFAQAPLPCDPGETLALVTDGLIEVFDRRDREFGLDRLKGALAAGAREPLDALAARVLREVRAHGEQMDDQTWLLIRRM